MQDNSDHYRNHLNNVMLQAHRNREEENRQRKQFKHDIKVEIFSVTAGAIAGLITSIIFWLLTE